MLENLKEQVFKANLDLVQHGLVKLTWGNVSGIDKINGYIVIKPSGISYSTMKISDLVVLDLDGNIIEGKLKPSSDFPTHLNLYKNFPSLGGIVHTHSTYATVWSQSCKSVPAFGTTHADHFYGEIPCTRKLSEKEITTNYEFQTGNVIVETLKNKNINSLSGILISCHGPFSWGENALKAVENAVALEEICKLAYYTKKLNPDISIIDSYLLDKHYFRKHGVNSYYGQK